MLEAEGLQKAFGSVQVTDGVSLILPEGRRHGVIGPNGAGKTTLFNLLTGELKPDAGRVVVDGRDVTSLPPDARVRAGLGRSFQRNNLFFDLSVHDNFRIACALAEGLGHVFWRSAKRYTNVDTIAKEHAERLGLGPDLGTAVKHLSYGSQRQLEIGLAVARRPKVLLLDEPTSGMSPDETAGMRKLITDLPGDLTLLIIEHDMDVLFGLTQRITVLDYGRVLLEGSPDEVRDSDEVRKRYLGTDQ